MTALSISALFWARLPLLAALVAVVAVLAWAAWTEVRREARRKP